MSTPDRKLDARGPNADQIDYWNGDAGEKWARHQDRLDAMLAPFSRAVLSLAGVSAGERILDIGCGCGATTFDFAAAAGDTGRALGADISAPMIARARERAAALGSSAEFLLADAASHDFAPGSFDILASRFGIMFFEQPVDAFRHLRGALAPGGRTAFICWRAFKDNPWAALPLMAARPLLPDQEPPAPGTPGPFAFDEADRFRGVLGQAGFRSIEIEPFDAELTLGAGAEPVEAALHQSLEIGPLSRAMKEMPEVSREAIAELVREALAANLKDGAVRLPGAVWLVSAKA
ncbi:MAG: SAM-dependent methyltransferase [Parvibaculum sp.]|nr:SAM-dependent methyltransferase [Parvibaculum sp.]